MAVLGKTSMGNIVRCMDRTRKMQLRSIYILRFQEKYLGTGWDLTGWTNWRGWNIFTSVEGKKRELEAVGPDGQIRIITLEKVVKLIQIVRNTTNTYLC